MYHQCSFCGNKKLKKFLSLGSMPLANSYLKKENLEDKKKNRKHPLILEICDECKLVQSPHSLYPKDFFLDYDYLSGVSSTWLKHCKDYTKNIIKNYKLKYKNDLILEIASNDGTLLKFFKEKNFKTLGIEPSKQATKISKNINKIKTVNDFFTSKLASKLKIKKPKLIIANNVIAHVKNINDFVKGLSEISHLNTIITIEFPYLKNLIDKRQFDTVYHEHHYYYSLTSINNLLSKYNLKIFNLDFINIHGGSVRIYACKINSKVKINNTIIKILKLEKRNMLNDYKKLKLFQKKINQLKFDALKKIEEILKNKKTIHIYGAAAKSNTMLNFFGLRNNIIKYAYDKNQFKINKFLPGSKIEIKDPKFIKNFKPDYIIIGPWNIAKEIKEQLKFTRLWNCKYILFIPKLKIGKF